MTLGDAPPLVDTGLHAPPVDPTELEGFPSAAPPEEVHRLTTHTEPWHYAGYEEAATHEGGRFDLPLPDGTCYAGATLDGCLVEKVLRGGVIVVPEERLEELWHAIAPVTGPMDLADMAARAAGGYGINGEVHTTLDYSQTRPWAEKFFLIDRNGIRYKARGDAAQEEVSIAFFGENGDHSAPPGVGDAVVTQLNVTVAKYLLRGRGIRVIPAATKVLTGPVPAKP